MAIPIARVSVVSLAVFGAFAQSAPAPAAFEVASIKRIQITGPVPGMTRETGPGSLTMRNVGLGFCIRWAYGLEPYQIVGPAWIDPPTEFRFDILAKAGSPIRDDQLKLMLQTLLAERFKLAVHREKRNLPVYALVVSKNGAKLRPADSGEESAQKPGDKPFQTICHNTSMAWLAGMMSPPWTSRPAVDRTGLPGGFDFTLDYGQYILDSETGRPVVDAMGHVDMESAVMRALPEQLGLRLEAAKAPVEVLVIDHLEKLPTGN